jgi:hypothetical protein
MRSPLTLTLFQEKRDDISTEFERGGEERSASAMEPLVAGAELSRMLPLLRKTRSAQSAYFYPQP